MRLPRDRGPISRGVIEALRRDKDVAPLTVGAGPVIEDGDVQLALWTLFELHYGGFEAVAAEREWDPGLISLRRSIERRFEVELRVVTAQRRAAVDKRGDVSAELLAMVEADRCPPLAAHLHRRATHDQLLDYLRERSVQQLKESDPQSFVLARLRGPAKVALAEIQYDEYGAGRPERLHQTLYAEALEAAGLDPHPGTYINDISAISLASANVMSLFALNRSLRGAAVGHFAAFEASSSVPSRKVAAGIERLGFAPAVAAYFHEHVEADAVHEQVAVRDLCGGLVSVEPELHDDVLFGAASSLHLEALSATELLDRWTGGATLEAVS